MLSGGRHQDLSKLQCPNHGGAVALLETESSPCLSASRDQKFISRRRN